MRNLLRQPIWIALMLIQPMFWLLLYSQLFRRITELPGFGTTSYVDYLTPGIAIMTAFFSGTWAGMGTIEDLDRGVIERFLATPARRSAIVFARILQSAVVATIQALIILVVGLFLGATNGGPLGWLVIMLAAFLVAGGFSGISNGIALLHAAGGDDDRGRELHRPAAAVLLLDPDRGQPDPRLDGDPLAREPRRVGRARLARPGAARAPTGARSGSTWSLLACFTALTGAFATRCFRSYQRTL